MADRYRTARFRWGTREYLYRMGDTDHQWTILISSFTSITFDTLPGEILPKVHLIPCLTVTSDMGAINEEEAENRSLPKSIRHKRILDLAAEQPEASLEAIAADVPSATVDLVEHVLEEHGDPASNGHGDDGADVPANAIAGDANSSAAGEMQFEKRTSEVDDDCDVWFPDDLTENQREVLNVISDNPTATQREIGEKIGVSAPTVSNRVNAIEGFEWEDREAMAKAVFAEASVESSPEKTTMDRNESGNPETSDQLQERVVALEEHVTSIDGETATANGLDDTELLHKVLRACFEADTITTDEEHQILKTLLR